MNSSIINILEILKAARSLKSLGFSSGYNFDKKSADDYFQELIQNVHPSMPVFAGILIIEISKDGDDFTVIDGLQRITTLSLLLSALCEAYKGTSKTNEVAREKILSRYLSCGDGVKLQLKGNDETIYSKIVLNEPLTEEESLTNLNETYKSFLQQIVEKKISATKLFDIISRIQFMVVFTDESKIPTRELYQSLNSNKNDLSQIKLITNFINQNCGEASETWNSIVESFKKIDLPIFIKHFVRDFLTIQNNGKIPRDGALYNGFKNHFAEMSEYQSPQVIIDNVKKYSNFYLKIIQADFEDSEIQKLITVINENNGQDSYSYLMEVFDDSENNLIDREMFLEILNMIKLFIKKRNEGSAEDMNISFASLSGELNRMLTSREHRAKVSDENKLTINEITHLSTFEV